MEVSVKAKCMCMFRRKMYGSKNSLAFSLQFFINFLYLKILGKTKRQSKWKSWIF